MSSGEKANGSEAITTEHDDLPIPGRKTDSDNVSVNSAALGDDLPPGYFYSINFLGTLLGFCLSAISAYIFLILPTNILSYINQDIGPSNYSAWVNIARTLALSFMYTILGPAIYGLGETVQLSFNVAIGELVPNKYRPMLLHERKTKREILKSLDYVGIFLWTAGLTIFLVGVSLGGSIYAWDSATTLSTLIVGAVLLIVLFIWEGFSKQQYPAIPVHFFRNRGFISLVACAAVASMFYYSAVLLWPQQIRHFFTTDVTYGGWLSCTVASSTALGQICAGGIIRWGGNVRYWMIFSTFAMVGFVASLAALTPEKKGLGIALTILGPFFVGFIELTSLALAPLFCKAEDIGLASGLLASIRSAGGSVAVAVYSAILSNRLLDTIPANIVPAVEAAGLSENEVPALLTAYKAGNLTAYSPAVRAAVDAADPIAYTQAFKTVYLASLGFGGIAIIGCLFAKDAQKHLTDKVERKMSNVRGTSTTVNEKLSPEDV
ncbi:MAG: hypothetical protein STHCBS139747_006094 [Sporothrix thermara]